MWLGCRGPAPLGGGMERGAAQRRDADDGCTTAAQQQQQQIDTVWAVLGVTAGNALNDVLC